MLRTALGKVWNPRTAPWFVALVAGLGAFWAARSYLADQVETTQSRYAIQFEMVRVVVASRDLQSGDVLDTENLAVRAFPARYAPSDIVREGESHRLEGRVVIGAVKAGDLLRESATTAARSRHLSSLIEPGRRALTIEVGEVDTFAGLLRVGDRVDLLLRSDHTSSISLSNRMPDPSITSLLQSVRVLATGASISANDAPDAAGVSESSRQFGTITLEVSPEEALRIALAQANGEFTVVLRGSGDTTTVSPTRLTLSQVLGLVAERVGKRSPSRTVEFIIGGRGGQPSKRGAR